MALEFWRPQHDRERLAVIRAIAGEEPAFIVNAGDVVCHGGRRADWQRFCRENEILFDRQIAYFPALGNHDLYGGVEEALRNRALVFPHIGKRRWYVVRFPPVLVAILDSNFDDLPADQIQMQDEWLSGLLRSAEEDRSIAHVVLVCHHPPYTNARGLSESLEVQNHFVSRITPKVKCFLSGHVHNYERFERGHVQFLVSGGGGGPPREVETDHPAHEDQYRGSHLRPFHYCRFRLEEGKLKCDVLMLDGEDSWNRVDGFVCP